MNHIVSLGSRLRAHVKSYMYKYCLTFCGMQSLLQAHLQFCTEETTRISTMTDSDNAPTTLHRTSTITLREITEDNWRPVANLRVSPAQAGNLASNPMSMVERHYSEDAWMRLVYADSTIVGFLMMAIWPPTDEYYIWRFMIDEKYRGLGFGCTVVRMAIQYVRKTYHGAKCLGVMSTPKEGLQRGSKVVKAEDSPCDFYIRLGFRQTAEPDEDGEIMMEINLAATTQSSIM
jgi:diamine N-acetyltransferase